MGWIDDLLGKTIMRGATVLPDRKILRFLNSDATVQVVDTPGTGDGLGSTDVTISAAGAANNAATSQSPTVADSGTRYYNTTAVGALTINLPAAPPVGTVFHGRVGAAFNLIFQANTGQTIRDDNTVGASAGSIRSAYVGAAITIEALSATVWMVTVSRGPWDLA